MIPTDFMFFVFFFLYVMPTLSISLLKQFKIFEGIVSIKNLISFSDNQTIEFTILNLELPLHGKNNCKIKKI